MPTRLIDIPFQQTIQCQSRFMRVGSKCAILGPHLGCQLLPHAVSGFTNLARFVKSHVILTQIVQGQEAHLIQIVLKGNGGGNVPQHTITICGKGARCEADATFPWQRFICAIAAAQRTKNPAHFWCTICE